MMWWSTTFRAGIKAIKNTAVTGDQPATILDPDMPFQCRFKQVTHLCKHGDHNANDNGNARADLNQSKQKYAGNRGTNHSACCAGQRFVRADDRCQASAPHAPPNKIGRDITRRDNQSKTQHKMMSTIKAKQRTP